jgi:DUF1365 family protein
VRSAIYEGELVHHRRQPQHGFRRRIAMPLLDLAEVDEVIARHPLWSCERTNAVSFRREDYLAGPATLDATVRDVVERAVGTRPTGPIALLAHVRTWGWLFNPIAVYYCYDATGALVEHAVADVTSTPWKEHHAYVIGAPGTHVVDKAMHVSPFFGMDQTYRIAYTAPTATARLSVSVHEEGAMVFGASMGLHRRPMSRPAMSRLLWRYPLLTMRVSAGIHAHALQLWRKGATFHAHPSAREVTDDRPPSARGRADEAA